MSTQTFWLSFADHNRPVGHQFLGAALVEVTEADVALAMPFLNQRREAFGLPPADEEACWLAGAIHKSHQLGCNSLRLLHVIAPLFRLLRRWRSF